jgi:hypothetical protein
VVAIVPYVALKVAWVAGIPWGWEDAGVITGTAMVAGDAITGAMALVGALLALAFTRGWGLRAPAWLVVFPAWVAAGFLVPVVAGLPVYGLLVAADRIPDPDADGRASGWLFPLVYATFFFLGVGLLASGGFYLHDRWGRLLGGAVGDGGPGATGPLRAILARAAIAISGCLGALNLYWLLGGTAGLDPRRLGERDYVFAQGTAGGAVAAGCLAAGLLLLTGDRGRGKPFSVVLALVGVGGAVLFAQGALNLAFGWLVSATGSIGNLGTEVPSPRRRVVFDIVNFFAVVGSGLGGAVALVHLAERDAALAGAAGRDGPSARSSQGRVPAGGGRAPPGLERVTNFSEGFFASSPLFAKAFASNDASGADRSGSRGSGRDGRLVPGPPSAFRA